jgi:hypothetical protein
VKLKHVPDIQEQIKHSFKIEESYSLMLESYVEYVSDQVGKTINKEEVISSIVKTFLDEDKQFLNWVKQRKKNKQMDSAESIAESIESTGNNQY